MKNFLKWLAAWRAKRKHSREWPVEDQLVRLRIIISTDHQWLANNTIADELCRRYLTALAPDWEKQGIEDICQFRRRIGLDPHQRIAKDVLP